MGYFNRDNNRSGSRGGNFRRDDFRSGDRGDRQMFDAVCSNCGKRCQVPFRPTGDKPVYCSDCFEKMGPRRSDSPRPERSNFRDSGFDQNKNQLDALNAKIDRVLKLLEPKATEIVVSPTVVEEIKTPKVKRVSKKTASVKEK